MLRRELKLGLLGISAATLIAASASAQTSPAGAPSPTSLSLPAAGAVAAFYDQHLAQPA